jgi:hypothetical protein
MTPAGMCAADDGGADETKVPSGLSDAHHALVAGGQAGHAAGSVGRPETGHRAHKSCGSARRRTA